MKRMNDNQFKLLKESQADITCYGLLIATVKKQCENLPPCYYDGFVDNWTDRINLAYKRVDAARKVFPEHFSEFVYSDSFVECAARGKQAAIDWIEDEGQRVRFGPLAVPESWKNKSAL